jgi:hypothetical protein
MLFVTTDAKDEAGMDIIRALVQHGSHSLDWQICRKEAADNETESTRQGTAN